jgi:hypothetical protein
LDLSSAALMSMGMVEVWGQATGPADVRNLYLGQRINSRQQLLGKPTAPAERKR